MHNKIIIICLLFLSVLNSSIYIAFSPNGIDRLIIALMMNISGFLLVVMFIKNIKTISRLGNYYKYLFIILLLWTGFVVINNFNFQFSSIVTLFGHYQFVWAWIVPLSIVIGFNNNIYLKLNFFFIFILIFGNIFAIIILATRENTQILFGILEWMAVLPILIFSLPYQKIQKKIIILSSLVLYVIISYKVSQRANYIFLFLIIVFYIIINRNSILKTEKSLLKIVFIGMIIIISVIWFSMNLLNIISDNPQLVADTRSFLYKELISDMDIKELIVGRGIMGTYYSPYFDYTRKHGLGGDFYIRIVNEIGYLHMILKGGIIMLVLNVAILLPVSIKGLSDNSDYYSKISGSYIMLYLFLWTVSYYSVYSFEYILLWIAAGYIINPNKIKKRNDPSSLNSPDS